MCCGAGRSAAQFFPVQFVEHVVGRAAKGVDRIHRAHVGHLFLVRFFAFAATRSAADPLFQRAAHRHPFAVGRGYQDLGLFVGRRRGALELEGFDVLGHLLVHLLGRPFTRRDTQPRVQIGHRFVKRLLDAQPLEPVFQDVGELAGRQPQPLVQGRRSTFCPSRAA